MIIYMENPKEQTTKPPGIVKWLLQGCNLYKQNQFIFHISSTKKLDDKILNIMLFTLGPKIYLGTNLTATRYIDRYIHPSMHTYVINMRKTTKCW